MSFAIPRIARPLFGSAARAARAARASREGAVDEQVVEAESRAPFFRGVFIAALICLPFWGGVAFVISLLFR